MSALGRTLLRPFSKLKARLSRLRNAYIESGRPPYKPTATVDFERASRERPLDPFHLEEMISDVVESDRRIEIAVRCRDMDDVPRVAEAGSVHHLEDGTRIQIMHNGLRILADGYYGDWNSRLIELCHGCHEPQEERVFHEVMQRISPKATMIELGGYWAFYRLWFLSGGKGRKSIVLEPDPKNLAVGQTNARLNGFSETFVQGFAWEDSAPADAVQGAYSRRDPDTASPQKAASVPVSFNRYSQTYFRNPLYDVAIMRRRG